MSFHSAVGHSQYIYFAVPVLIGDATGGEAQFKQIADKLGVTSNEIKIVTAAAVVKPDGQHISPSESAQHVQAMFPAVGKSNQALVDLEEENALLRAEIDDLRRKLETVDVFKRETLHNVKLLKDEVVGLAQNALAGLADR